MVTVVLVLNGLLALFCLYVAWQVCRWRSILANVADALTIAERCSHRVLHGAPQAIATGQLGAAQLRQQYRLLTLQLQQVQQILALLGLGQWAWRQYRRQPKPGSSHRQTQPRSFATEGIVDDLSLEKNFKKNFRPKHSGSTKSPRMF